MTTRVIQWGQTLLQMLAVGSVQRLAMVATA
jgi:hypothetical protein